MPFGRHPVIRTEILPSRHPALATETDGGVRSVCIGFWVGTGSRDEDGERAGLVALPRAPALQGHRPTARPSAIAEAVDEVGGDFNAFTTKEYTSFYIRLLAEHLSLGPRHPLRHHVASRRCGPPTSRPSGR